MAFVYYIDDIQDEHLVGIDSKGDRQRAQRHPVRVAGRYLLVDRTEWNCQTVDMSATGLLLRGPARPLFGQVVVVYLDKVGRIEGTVARLDASKFALRIHATERKRQQIAALLASLANGEAAPSRLDPALLARAAPPASAWLLNQSATLAAAHSPPHAAGAPAPQPHAVFRIYLDSL
jgi:hypothetical protein